MRNYSGVTSATKPEAECSVKMAQRCVYPKPPTVLIMDDKDLDDEESQKRITNLGREYSKKAAYRDEHYVADLMDKLFAYRRSKYKNPLLKP